MINIVLLYFIGCLSWQKGLENLKSAIAAENLEPNIQLVRVESNKEAKNWKFLGSPSFRVNGQELWPEEQEDYYLGCRVYNTGHGFSGFPSVEMIQAKLQEIRSSEIPR
ncbi:MAG TPA: hypothetical protein VN364_04465 [Bellilinea sp.]|nr:hypothetical protein [Bellilinea sp.]